MRVRFEERREGQLAGGNPRNSLRASYTFPARGTTKLQAGESDAGADAPVPGISVFIKGHAPLENRTLPNRRPEGGKSGIILDASVHNVPAPLLGRSSRSQGIKCSRLTILCIGFGALSLRAMKKELSPKQILGVRCPTCGAAPKEKCKLGSGQPRTKPHRDRRLIAKD